MRIWLKNGAIGSLRPGQRWLAAGVNVAHLHLLPGDEARKLVQTGGPVVVTLHNAVQGWQRGQRGQAELRAGDVDLLVPCSRSADRDAAALGSSVPRRVIGNGVDPAWIARLPRDDEAAQASRRQVLGVPRDHSGPVLLALANPRRQKRLERLPAIVASLVARGVDAFLILAGEIVGTDAASRTSVAAWDEAIAASDVAARIARPGPQTDLAALFAVSDLLVSVSAYEGLSGAHLEALTAGVPLVVTDVAHADETARLHPGRVTLVPVEADGKTFAEAVVAALAQAISRHAAGGLSTAFGDAMASAYRALLEPAPSG